MTYDPADGPPTLLLTCWVPDLFQRIEGFKEPSAIFGKRRQRSVSRLIAAAAPKTFENFNIADHHPRPETIEKLRKWRLEEIEARGTRPYDEPLETTTTRVKNLDIPPGFAAAFFMGLPDLPGTALPHTRNMAAALDELASALLAQQCDGKGGSLEGYKQTLLNSPLAPPLYWINPDSGLDVRPYFEQAADWPSAWALTHLVIFQQLLSLLALWDVEYCADIFGGLKPIPLFLQLAPRLRSRASDYPTGGLRRLNLRQKEVVATPVAQLIDLVWCLLKRIQDDKWPDSFPKDTEICTTLNDSKDNLACLRIGRPNLTRSKFTSLWPDNIQGAEGSIIGPPITLLAVAHLWDLIYLDMLKSIAPLTLVDAPYMRAWHHHRRELGLDVSHHKQPNEAWPTWLDRGLDYPAPE